MSAAGICLSILAIAAGLGVVATRNPLYSAFALVTNLIAVAGLYAVLDAHFLAVAQVIVYAGAIMVLVLFVLMLLNVKTDEGTAKLSLVRLIVAMATVSLLLVVALPAVMSSFDGVPPYELTDRASRAQGTVRNVGMALYGEYVVQFELASLVLLVGLVGAVMLAKRKTVQLAPRSFPVGDK